MNTKEIVKQLAEKNKMTIAEVERKSGIANGTIGKWDKQNPSIEPLQKLANFFNVSTDYLLGREDKNVNKAKNMFAFDGEIVTDEEYDFLKSVLAAKRASEKNK